MAGFQHIQLRYFHIQITLFNDKRVAGGQRLDLGIGERRFINIVGHTDGRFRGHDLRDKLLLVLYKLVEIGVKGVLRHITVNIHLRVLVALADDTPQPLREV